jgi:Leucine-rich repeat (LRR) protein
MIKRLEGIDNLRFLRFLNLSSNMIKSIQGIPEKHEFLESIDLEDNKVKNFVKILSNV